MGVVEFLPFFIMVFKYNTELTSVQGKLQESFSPEKSEVFSQNRILVENSTQI